MFREVARWSGFAVPTAGVLVTTGVVGVAGLGSTEPQIGAPGALAALAFLLWQTVAPIAAWVAVTSRWPALRDHLAVELVSFPFAVALAGAVAILLIGGRVFPRSADVLGVSIFGWLGFSWALLAARAVAERLFMSRSGAGA